MATLEQIMTETPVIPHSEKVEAIVLGKMLTEWGECVEYREQISPDTFYITKHQEIYRAILSVADRGEQVDIMTVLNECMKLGYKVNPVDMAVLTKDYSPSIAEHVAILVEKQKRRKFFEIGALLQSNAFSEINDINDVLADVRDRLDNIVSSNRDNVSTIRDAIEAVDKVISKNLTGACELTGDPTGFSVLDKRSGGLQTSDLIIIAADTSMGKTSLAIKMAMNCGCPVAFYSMEMKKEQIAARMISIASGVSSNEILYSRLDSGKIQRIDKGIAKISGKPIYFDDRGTSNIETILSSIRMMKIKYGIKGVVVDYLQILNVNMKSSNKEQQMGDVARRLKNIAKELDIWVIALSQLSRDNQNPAPTLSRLRDSGQIAEAADMVMLIYRPEVYGKRYTDDFSSKEVKGTAMIDIAKGRNIGLLKFLVGFNSRTTNFYEIESVPMYQSNSNEDEAHDLPF